MIRRMLSHGAAVRVAVFVAAAAATALVHARIEPTPRFGRGETFVPRPNQARLSAFGFAALLADYHWLHAVQVVGGEHGKTEAHAPLIARLVDVATTLDPWVDHPYRFAALWLTDSIDEVRFANRLLERGVAYHPKDWRNRHYLGFNYFYYLGDEKRAAEVLAPAAKLPGSPPYLGALVAKLRLGHGSLEATAAFLAELVRDTDDEFKRAEYEKELDEIQVERWARVLDAAREEFRRRRGRDLARVEELVEGPGRVLASLPPGHPHFAGFAWELDRKSDRIVSSFYRMRYELHVHPFDRERRDSWQKLAAETSE